MAHVIYIVVVFLGVLIWFDYRFGWGIGGGSFLIGTINEIWCIIKKCLKKTND
jgi:hypothetical protein